MFNELSEINNENAYFMGYLLLLPSKHCIIIYNTLVLGVPIFLGTPNTTRWRPGDFTIEAVLSYPVCRDQWKFPGQKSHPPTPASTCKATTL